MNEHCKDCTLQKRVEVLENTQSETIKRINALELSNVRTEERVITIFKMLNEIKDNIATLVTDVSYIKNKPGKTYEKLQYEVIKYIVLLGAGYFAAKYMK